MYIPEKQSIPIEDRELCLHLLSLFKIENKPAHEVITEGQLEIFWCIVCRPSTRAQIICSTQYGKSLTVALACIVVSCIQEEVIAVVAPSNEKAKIIMRYYIEHIGDNVLFSEKLDKHTRLDRLRQEESKDRIMLRKSKNGDQGGIFVVSANTANTKKSLEAAMGLGSRIVIGDEYCLIPDDTESTIFRMISGKGPEAFYCKIGNPFYRDEPYSHFYKTWDDRDNNYHKIFIDYKQAVEEGRYNMAFINEAKQLPSFEVLYECRFPDPGTTDKDGWTPILTETEIELAQMETENIQFAGTKLLGVDCSEGKGVDSSVDVLRSMNIAECIFESNTVDEMQHAGQVILDIENNNINSLNVAIDNSGGGVISRCREQGKAVQSINTADSAVDSRRFFNKRAEGYWAVRQWIKNGGKLKPHKRWIEFKYIKYKVHSSGRIIILDKPTIKKNSKKSPDLCDALMHTFVIPTHMGVENADQVFFARKMRANKMKNALRKIKGY